MARYQGDMNRICFLYESGTYAATSGTGQWIGLVNEHEAVVNPNRTPLRYVGDTMNRNVEAFADLALDVDGTLSFHPQDWKFLMFVLGSNVDGGSPSPYTHTISELNGGSANAFTSGVYNPFISFALEEAQVATGTGLNLVRTIKGGIVNTMTISAAERDFVNVEINYIAQSETYSSGAATAVTAATTRPFVFSDGKIHIPSGTVINGIRDWSLTINNNAERANYATGSIVTQAPKILTRDYEVELKADGMSEHSKTFWDAYYRGGSEFNMMIEINASTGSRDAFIVLSGCRLTNMPAPITGTEINEQTLTIQPKTASVLVNDTIELYNAF